MIKEKTTMERKKQWLSEDDITDQDRRAALKDLTHFISNEQLTSQTVKQQAHGHICSMLD